MKCLCGLVLDTASHQPITCTCGRFYDWVDFYHADTNSWTLDFTLVNDITEEGE